MKISLSAIASKFNKQFHEVLAPLGQLGVATLGGGESITHAIRLAMNNKCHIAKLDIKNAYNTISRSAIQEAVANHFPILTDIINNVVMLPTSRAHRLTIIIVLLYHVRTLVVRLRYALVLSTS